MDKATALKRTAARYVAPIDPIELAVTIAVAYAGAKRPDGLTSVQAFLRLDQDMQDAWLAAAHAAMRYWQECIAAANTGN